MAHSHETKKKISESVKKALDPTGSRERNRHSRDMVFLEIVEQSIGLATPFTKKQFHEVIRTALEDSPGEPITWTTIENGFQSLRRLSWIDEFSYGSYWLTGTPKIGKVRFPEVEAKPEKDVTAILDETMSLVRSNLPNKFSYKEFEYLLMSHGKTKTRCRTIFDWLRTAGLVLGSRIYFIRPVESKTPSMEWTSGSSLLGESE